MTVDKQHIPGVLRMGGSLVPPVASLVGGVPGVSHWELQGQLEVSVKGEACGVWVLCDGNCLPCGVPGAEVLSGNDSWPGVGAAQPSISQPGHVGRNRTNLLPWLLKVLLGPLIWTIKGSFNFPCPRSAWLESSGHSVSEADWT